MSLELIDKWRIYFLFQSISCSFFAYDCPIGKLIQIDSGPSGIVYGVNSHHMIFCRRAITPRRPKGRGWQRVPGALKYVSCGIYGCWGVNNNNQTWFRHDVTGKNCVGSKWVRISGSRSKLGVTMDVF